MYHIGIDIGSTYTKYCVMDRDRRIVRLYSEKTPVRQKEYFQKKYLTLLEEFPGAGVVSCGYGKKNIQAVRNVNELTALAMGAYGLAPSSGVILDIGGQDTKVISHEKGKLGEFFLNDKCAAGSGMFLANTLRLLEMEWEEIDLSAAGKPLTGLSSTCAVFAQSEIVGLLAENWDGKEIIAAVVRQILVKAKPLLDKVWGSSVLLSGGLTQIVGFREFAQEALDRECRIVGESAYLSAAGCALLSG